MKYATIVADPPWRYKTTLPGFMNPKRDAHLMVQRGMRTRREARRSVTPYPTMSIEEIAALPVADLAAKDAHLYLWTTSTHLPHAFGIVEAWGFKYSTLLVWCKRPRGSAGFPTYSIRTEYVLFCRRGSLRAKERQERNWWEWARGPHSQKPEHFLDMVETVSPGPYLEMFSRRHRLGWDVMGDEVNSSVEVSA
jgi:N6-adenosine-specific RNA methylase IME4